MGTVESATETSVISSLEDIMRLEQERIARQERERVREEQERHRQEVAARERATRLEEQRLQEEAKRRREEELRAREEEARLEAMQRAILETETARALEQSRWTRAEQQRTHALELERATQAERSRRARIALVAVSCGAALAIGVLSVAWLGISAPAAERRTAELQGRASRLEQDNEGLRRQLQTATTSMDRAIDRLRASEEQRGVLVSRLSEAERELERRGTVKGGTGPAAPAARPAGPSCTNPQDPMCQDGQVLR